MRRFGLPQLRTAAVMASLAFACAAAGPVFAKPGQGSGKDFIQPGYWETVTTMTSPFHQEKSEQRCVKPADVLKFMQPCNHHYNCEYPTQEIADGHIMLKGQWVGVKDGQVIEVAGHGTYTHDTLHAEADMRTSFLGLPLSGHAVTDAHRISGECPAPPAP